MNIIRDTYFFDSSKALEVAMQKNSLMPLSNMYCSYKLFDYSAQDEYVQFDYKDMQICYYGGELLDNCPENLVHLPLESFYEFCLNTRYRLPQIVDFEGLDASELVKVEIYGLLKVLIEKVFADRKILTGRFIDSISTSRLDFNEPLRVFLVASRHTRVMQYCSRDIADAFMEIGFDVKFEIESNSMEVIENYHWLKSLSEYNPHVTININHMNNEFLNDAIFNIVWFQDPMSRLLDGEPVWLRSKDFIFSLTPAIDSLLVNKKIPFERQSFCTNNRMSQMIQTIKRENKIVFIGSSYYQTISHSYEALKSIDYLTNIFLDGENFGNDLVEDVCYRFGLDSAFVETRLLPYIVRDIGLLNFVRRYKEYDIELYGWGWDVYDELQPYYKGVLKHGEEIEKVYCSARFAFAPHQNYTLQQRVFEAASCGAIPIVYDCLSLSKEARYQDLIYFKRIDDLSGLFDIEAKDADFSNFLNVHNYKSFARKIIKLIGSYNEIN